MGWAPSREGGPRRRHNPPGGGLRRRISSSETGGARAAPKAPRRPGCRQPHQNGALPRPERVEPGSGAWPAGGRRPQYFHHMMVQRGPFATAAMAASTCSGVGCRPSAAANRRTVSAGRRCSAAYDTTTSPAPRPRPHAASRSAARRARCGCWPAPGCQR